MVKDLLVVSSPLDGGRGKALGGLRLDGLHAGEGSEGTRRDSADAGGDGDETLEHCCNMKWNQSFWEMGSWKSSEKEDGETRSDRQKRAMNSLLNNLILT